MRAALLALVLVALGQATISHAWAHVEGADILPDFVVQGRLWPGPAENGELYLPQTFTYPASILTKIEGDGIALSFGDAADIPEFNFGTAAFQVWVDGTLAASFLVSNEGASNVTVGLGSGIHQIRITKINEPQGGIAVLEALVPLSSQHLTARFLPLELAELPTHITSGRRILYIGDSFTAGYGILGNSSCVNQDSLTSEEDALLTWPVLTATALDADWQIVAWSGAGGLIHTPVYEVPNLIYPSLSELVFEGLPGEPSTVIDTDEWVPQVVFIEVGWNDFKAGVPDEEAWVDAFIQLLQNVSIAYDNPAIFLTLVPFIPALESTIPPGQQAGQPASTVGGYATALTRVYTEAQEQELDNVSLLTWDPTGLNSSDWCLGHPDIAAHANFANQTVDFLTEALPDWVNASFPPANGIGAPIISVVPLAPVEAPGGVASGG